MLCVGRHNSPNSIFTSFTRKVMKEWHFHWFLCHIQKNILGAPKPKHQYFSAYTFFWKRFGRSREDPNLSTQTRSAYTLFKVISSHHQRHGTGFRIAPNSETHIFYICLKSKNDIISKLLNYWTKLICLFCYCYGPHPDFFSTTQKALFWRPKIHTASLLLLTYWFLNHPQKKIKMAIEFKINSRWARQLRCS